MSKQPHSNQHHYQIMLKGQLDDHWDDWFDGMAASHSGDITILKGPVADQAALRGLLNQIWDFNLILIAVERLERC